MASVKRARSHENRVAKRRIKALRQHAAVRQRGNLARAKCRQDPMPLLHRRQHIAHDTPATEGAGGGAIVLAAIVGLCIRHAEQTLFNEATTTWVLKRLSQWGCRGQKKKCIAGQRCGEQYAFSTSCFFNPTGENKRSTPPVQDETGITRLTQIFTVKGGSRCLYCTNISSTCPPPRGYLPQAHPQS